MARSAVNKMLDKVADSIFPYLYRSPKFGRSKFWTIYMVNRLISLLGYSNYTRAIEYPWCLSRIKKDGKNLLEVGCVTSYFSHELIADKKRNLHGIDLREYPSKPKNMKFMREDIRTIKLEKDLYDVIVSISTIEHIGLDGYGTEIKDDNGDFVAMKRLKEALKPSGRFLITVPYAGKFGYTSVFTRIYDEDRIAKLTEGYIVCEKNYFIYQNRRWVKVGKEKAQGWGKPERAKFAIICLALSK